MNVTEKKTTKERTIIEIDMEILRACVKPTIITYVMYDTHLNCSRLYERIGLLAAKGFLSVIETSKTTRYAIHNGHREPNYALKLTPHKRVIRRLELTELGKNILKLWTNFFMQYER